MSLKAFLYIVHKYLEIIPVLTLASFLVLLSGCGSGGWSALHLLGGGSDGRETPLPFRIPKGYTATRVASAPLVTPPMFACFDDEGRLYVAGSSGHNLDANALRKDPTDVI